MTKSKLYELSLAGDQFALQALALSSRLDELINQVIELGERVAALKGRGR